jgi:predicted helicase
VRNQKVSRGVLRYFSFDEYARREEKFRVLDAATSLESINWSDLKPDARHTWVRTGLRDDFADLIPLVGKGRGGASASLAIF